MGVEPPPSKRPVAHAYCVPWLFASYLWYEKRERVLETHCGLVATCVFLGLSQNQCVRTIWARNTKNWKKNRKTTEIELRNKNYFRRSRSRGRPGFLYGNCLWQPEKLKQIKEKLRKWLALRSFISRDWDIIFIRRSFLMNILVWQSN